MYGDTTNRVSFSFACFLYGCWYACSNGIKREVRNSVWYDQRKRAVHENLLLNHCRVSSTSPALDGIEGQFQGLGKVVGEGHIHQSRLGSQGPINVEYAY